VAVSSLGHRRSPVVFEDIHFERRAYDPWLAYGQSKTANVLFAVEATRRFAGDGITANALMPGGIVTNLQRYMDPAVVAGWSRGEGTSGLGLKTPQQGAATSVLLATSPDLAGIGGRYFEDCNEAQVSPTTPTRPRACAPTRSTPRRPSGSGRCRSSCWRRRCRRPANRAGANSSLAAVPLREVDGLERERLLPGAPHADECALVLLAEEDEPAVARPRDARALQRHVRGCAR